MAPSDQFTKSAWMLASIAVVVAALYLAKGVLVPLTLAVLLSFLLSPVCDWLERRRLGRIPAVLVTAILGFAVLGIAAWTAVVQMTDLAPKMPEYQDNLQAKLHSTNDYVSAALSKVTRTAEGFGQNLPQSEQAEQPQGTDRAALLGSRAFLAGEPTASHWRNVRHTARGAGLGRHRHRARGLLPGPARGLARSIHPPGGKRPSDRDHSGAGRRRHARQPIPRRCSSLINVTFGVAVGIGLYLIGVPNAILWGILATTLRFIPYIGPWIAAAMPIGLSMAISTGWVAPILTVGLFVVLELFSNNVMEPWLYGKNTGVSAVAVLVAAVFWTWLWGIVGLLLATPLTVCLLVIGKHVPQLSFLDILLGNEPVFEPKKRVYQRLLAGDQEEAAELLDEYLEHSRWSRSTTRC